MIIPVLLGIFSSWHCLAMCGPLFSALLFTTNNGSFSWLNFFLYQFSRVLIYGVLGLLPLIFGISNIPVYIQQYITVFCGIIILALTWINFTKNSKISNAITSLVKKINSKGIKINNSTRFIFLGAANGLLPCGMVYIALVASIGNISIIHPTIFMMLFGLSTIPVFFVLYLIRNTFIGNSFLKSIFKVKTIILTAVALLLIIRGLNLNIPYMSPSIINTSEKAIISCCHAPNK